MFPGESMAGVFEEQGGDVWLEWCEQGKEDWGGRTEATRVWVISHFKGAGLYPEWGGKLVDSLAEQKHDLTCGLA